jgi:DNA-directed RNA polymerase subunit RPC12/RpoP
MTQAIVGRFATVGEAEVARSALHAGHISADLIDVNLIAIQWLYSQAIGGVKLLVRDEDRQEAELLLSERAMEAPSVAANDQSVQDSTSDAERPNDELLAPSDELRCPACSGVDIMEIPKLRLLGIIAVLIFGVGVAVNQLELALAGAVAAGLTIMFVTQYRCRNCGERWNEADSAKGRTLAPLPEPADIAGLRCPRCGTAELHYLRYRRLKAIPLLISITIVVIVPLWLFMPKKQCDHCAARVWL